HADAGRPPSPGSPGYPPPECPTGQRAIHRQPGRLSNYDEILRGTQLYAKRKGRSEWIRFHQADTGQPDRGPVRRRSQLADPFKAAPKTVLPWLMMKSCSLGSADEAVTRRSIDTSSESCSPCSASAAVSDRGRGADPLPMRRTIASSRAGRRHHSPEADDLG